MFMCKQLSSVATWIHLLGTIFSCGLIHIWRAVFLVARLVWGGVKINMNHNKCQLELRCGSLMCF